MHIRALERTDIHMIKVLLLIPVLVICLNQTNQENIKDFFEKRLIPYYEYKVDVNQKKP